MNRFAMGVSMLLVALSLVATTEATSQAQTSGEPLPAEPPVVSPPPAGPATPTSLPNEIHGGANVAQPAFVSGLMSSAGDRAADPWRLAVEMHTTGFLGSLNGGLFFGAASKRLLLGCAFDVNYRKFDQYTASGAAVVPTVKWTVAGSRESRVELLVEAQAGWEKRFIGDGDGFVAPDGQALFVGVGPGLRLWITDGLTIGYTGLLVFYDAVDRNQNVVSLDSTEQQLGQAFPSPRSRELRSIYMTGELQLTGYF